MAATDVIGILGFALHASHRLYELGKKWVDAPQEMRDLLVEVGRVQGILKQALEANINRVAGSTSLDVLKFHPELIEQMEELANTAHIFVEKMTTVRGDGTREVKRIRWMFKASEAKGLTTKFQAFYGAISAIYAVNTSAIARSIEPSIVAAGRTVVVMIERSTHAAQHELASTLNRTLKQTFREERACLVEGLQDAFARTVVRTLTSAARDQREGHSQLFDELSILRNNAQATHGLLDGGFPLVTQDAGKDSTNYLIGRPSTSSLDVDRRSIMSDATCDSLDTVAPHQPPDSSSKIQLSCLSDCLCCCHRSSNECCLIPPPIVSGLRMHLPGAFISSLASPTLSCDDTGCVRNRERLLAMRRLFPTWFAQVEGTIRFRSCPIHFKIQTPRIVESLYPIYFISLEAFRMKLTNREITVNDTQRNGFTIFHALMARAAYEHEDPSTVYEMIHSANDAGARYDWEFSGFTVTEYAVHYSKLIVRDTSVASSLLQSFDRNIAKPLLGEDVEEAWDNMRMKRNWNDLHSLLANPPNFSTQLKHTLAAILNRPSASLNLNVKDRFGWPPLRHAICTCPEAVDALLRAGANPALVRSPLGYAAQALSWSAVSPLVREGANINKRARWPDGSLTTPLHDIIRTVYSRPGDRLRTALELVRHGGRLLDWDFQDEHGWTPLDCAEWRMNQHPNDGEVASVYELYKARKPPRGAHLIERSRLDHEEGVVDFTSTSLINAGVEGNTSVIGALISAGAMVNECDEAGRTLLHLVAMGAVSNGHAVVVEVVRHGGYGVDWDALTVEGQTAEDLAEQTLQRLSANERKKSSAVFSPIRRKLRRILPTRLKHHSSPCYKITREEAAKILELLRRRALPRGIDYIYPCMDPKYCGKCSSLPCTGRCIR